MAVIKEDFIRCEKCNRADFEEVAVLTIPKTAKPRESNLVQLDERTVREYSYRCVACHHPLKL